MKVGNAIALEAHEDGSDEWHAQRSRGIGGSDAATIIGLNPFGQDRVSLYRRKIGEERGFSGNAATRFGSKIESYVFSRAAIEVGSGALAQVDQSLKHPELPWMLANIDGAWLKDGEVRGIVEIKTSWQPPKGDGVYAHHYAQMQHYLAVTGLNVALYIYLSVPMDRQTILDIGERFIAADRQREFWDWIVDRCDMNIQEVERDDAYISKLIDAEKAFWDCVTTQTEPGEYLPDGEVRVESEELVRLMDALARTQAQRPKTPKELSAKEKELKEKIKAHVAAISAAHDDARKIYVGDHYITWNARGYWMPKPAKPKTSEDIEVPF